jgi:hypothetical protein
VFRVNKKIYKEFPEQNKKESRMRTISSSFTPTFQTSVRPCGPICTRSKMAGSRNGSKTPPCASIGDKSTR